MRRLVAARSGARAGALALSAALAVTGLAVTGAPGAAAQQAPAVPTAPTASTAAAAAVLGPVGEDGLWRLEAPGWPAPPAIDAEAWILVDVTTGQVLDGHREHLARPPASTTKLLTALAVARRTDRDDVVTIDPRAVGLEGATAGLRGGQQVPVDDLLALLLLRSGNDAAEALALHVGGSPEGFAALLQAEADALGLRDAVVVEPHGLFDRNRLSARSLAVVGRAVLADPRLRPMVAASSWQLSDGRTITNRNELLDAYAGSTGLKTGMTRAAGWSLVASARKGQRHLVAVVLGGPDANSRFTASAALLDHGFTAFAPARAVPDLRVRHAGAWLRVVPQRHVELLPLGATPELVPALPVEPDAPAIRWAWDGGSWLQPSSLGRVRSSPVAAPVRWGSSRSTDAPPLVGRDHEATAALGAWLSGRIQAGMRAATVADAWPRD